MLVVDPPKLVVVLILERLDAVVFQEVKSVLAFILDRIISDEGNVGIPAPLGDDDPVKLPLRIRGEKQKPAVQRGVFFGGRGVVAGFPACDGVRRDR